MRRGLYAYRIGDFACLSRDEPLQVVGVYRQLFASGTTPAVLRYANGRTAHIPRFTGVTVSRHRVSASTTRDEQICSTLNGAIH